MSDWVKDGYVPAYTEYPAAIALFTSGESAMHINGVWEVPTLHRPRRAGQARLRVGRDRAAGVLQPRLHLFGLARLRDPEQRRQDDDAGEARGGARGDQRGWSRQALFWATAGHIPALKAVTDSAEYKAMQPNATYAVLTANMVYDPKSKFAGVASPMFDAAGNAFTAAVNGEEDPADAVDQMKEELDALE